MPFSRTLHLNERQLSIQSANDNLAHRAAVKLGFDLESAVHFAGNVYADSHAIILADSY
jgi:hypothetical protein